MSTADFKITDFAEEHISSVAELERSCFSSPISEANLRALLLGGIGKGFVCIETKSGNISAYGGVIVAAGEAQILNIATHENFRRQGLGRLVVKSILEYSEALGAEYITLEVRENNLPAIRLYESLGFFEVGKIKDYYVSPKENALILKKDLSASQL